MVSWLVLLTPWWPTCGSFTGSSLPEDQRGSLRSRAGRYCLDFLTVPTLPPQEHAQHTEEILLEMGLDWDRIAALKETGAIN